MEDKDSYVQTDNACDGEIILGNPFLIASGLDVKYFLAKHIERLASIDYGELDQEEPTAKDGKLGLKLLSQEIDGSIAEPDSSKLCSMISNATLKDGDDIDYKDVEVGDQDEEGTKKSIESMIDRGWKHLKKDSRKILKDLVVEDYDIFRLKLGKDPPVDVEPMKIEFEESNRPIKVRQRTYSPEQ